MSNARDKANIPALNFSSTGIDDNATSTAITIDSSERVGIGTTAPTVPLMVQSNVIQPLLLKGANDKQMVVETTGGSTQITSYQLKNSAYSWQIENGRSANTFTIRSSVLGETVRIDASGNVGIGTTSPTSPLMVQSNVTNAIHAKGANNKVIVVETTNGETGISVIQLKNSAHSYNVENGRRANTLTFYSGTTGERMCIDPGGNVGIGTSSPSARLSVESGSIALNSNFNSSNANGAYVRFQNSGTSIGDIGAGASVVSGGTAGDFAIASRSGNLDFGTGSVRRMRIDSSGNVGIGTASPDTPLEVHLSSSGNAIKISGTSTNTPYLAFENEEGGTAYVRGRIRNASSGVTGGLVFDTGSSGSMSERMRIDTSGSVFIGTTSSSGDVNNGKNLSAGTFSTRRRFHTFSATNTWETVETFSSNSGTYLLTALGSGGGVPATDNYIGFLSINGSGTHIQDVKTATRVQVQMSGLNLQIKQQFFSTANITYSLLRLNA